MMHRHFVLRARRRACSLLLLLALFGAPCSHPPPPRAPSLAQSRERPQWDHPPVLVPQVELTLDPQDPPLVFAPDAPVVGMRTTNDCNSGPDCDLFHLTAGVYLGRVPGKVCASWRTSCENSRAADGKYVWNSEEAVLQIFEVAKVQGKKPKDAPAAAQQCLAANDSRFGLDLQTGSPIRIEIKAKPPVCQRIATADFSPDGERIAVACTKTPRIYVYTIATGQLVASIAIGNHEQATELRWGKPGLAALTLADSETKFQPQTAVYFWPSLVMPPRRQEFKDTDDLHYRVTLDPLARYVFIKEYRNLQGAALRVYDLAQDRPGPLGWEHFLPKTFSLVRQEGKWLPGKYPVFQTIEVEGVEEPRYYAWRLRTAPWARGLSRVLLGSAEPAHAYRVLDDGQTVVETSAKPPGDPPSDGGTGAAAGVAAVTLEGAGPFVATAYNSLRRMADGEELIFGEQGGARSGRGVYSGSVHLIEDLVFRLEEDLLHTGVVRGAQLAAQLENPHLIDDFFDGKLIFPSFASRAH